MVDRADSSPGGPAILRPIVAGRLRSRGRARYNRRVRLHAVLAVLAFAALAGGCFRVAPYERATLARPDMSLGGDPDLTAGEDHARAYREGSTGGARMKAGGCGCN